MKNKIEILSVILSVIKKDDTKTPNDVSDLIELKPKLTESYFELLDSWKYITPHDRHSGNDAKYSVTTKGEKLLAFLKKRTVEIKPE